MAAITLTIKFNVDPPNVQQALDAVNTSLKNIGVSITNVAEKSDKINTLDDGFVKLGLRLQGFMNAFSVLNSTFGQFIQISNEGEQAVASLSQAMKQQGAFSEVAVADLQGYAAQLQQLTGIDDDLTIKTMAQLTAMGLQGESLKRATVLAQDLSVTMGTDLSAAARVMADAFNGNTGMLGRYVKGLDEADIKARGAQSIIEQLTKAVGGQAEALGNTGAGSVAKFNATLDDLKQAMGDILKSALMPLMGVMTSWLKVVVDAPPAVHTLALGVTSLGVAFAFLNTSMGGIPYIIGGIITLGLALGVAINDWTSSTKKMASSSEEAQKQLALLQNRIETMGDIVPTTTPKLEQLRKKIAELLAPSEETFLADELARARAEAERLAANYRDGKALLAEQVALERQGQELRDPEKLKRWFEIFTDGNMRAEDELARIKSAADAAATAMAEKEAALTVLRLENGKKQRDAVVQTTVEVIELEEQSAKHAIEQGKKVQLPNLELSEKEALNKAETEEEKTAITREFALRRIDIETAASLAVLNAERAALDARRKLVPTKDRQAIDQRLTEISTEEKTIKETAEIQKRIIAIEVRKPDLAPLGSIRKAEEDLAKAQEALRNAASDADRAAARERVRIAQAALDAINLNEEEKHQRAMQRAAERERLWQDEHRVAMAFFDSIAAGSATMWQQFVVGNRQAKDEWDAVWLSMRNTALNALGVMLTEEIRSFFVKSAMRKAEVAEHAVAEGTKTATTEAGALARVATTVWEGTSKVAIWLWETATFIAEEVARTAVSAAQAAIRIAGTIAESVVKIGVWAAEQAAFIAKEIAMTVVFLAQQAIRVAAALVEAAASIVKAVAQAIAAAGPFGLFLGAALTALGVAVFSGLKKAFGFARGGQFEANQRGFIEGGQTEIIAPRRTFDEIMRNEIVPMLVRTTQIVTLQYQSGALAFADSRIVKRLEQLERTLNRKEWSPVFTNMRDEQEILRQELPRAERVMLRKRR